MKETLTDLLDTACAPDNLDVFFRKSLDVLAGPGCFGPKAGLAILPEAAGLPCMFRNFSRSEQLLLRAKAELKNGKKIFYLAAPLTQDGKKAGRMIVRLSAPLADPRAAGMLEMAAKLTSARLSSEKRDAAINRERDTATAVKHIEELYLACPGISTEEISRSVLDEARRLTGSPSGFAGYLDPATGWLIVASLTENILDKKLRGKNRSYILKKFNGPWGWVLKNRKPLLANTAASLPGAAGTRGGRGKGDRFLGVPAMSGSRLLGMLALADRDGAYSEVELEAALELANVYAVILRRTIEEKRFREETKKQLDIISSSKDLIYSADLEGRITYISDGVKNYGYKPEEIVGRKVLDLCHPEDRAANARAFANAMKSGRTLPLLAYRIPRKDGTYFYAEQTSNVVAPFGKPLMITGVIRDVTWRHDTEAALKASETKYRELVENINDVLFTLDPEGIITYISPQVFPMTGFKPKEITGRSFTEIIYPEDLPELRRNFNGMLVGRLKPSEYRWQTRDGSVRWAHSFSRPVIEGGKVTAVLGILSDITERKRLETTLKESESRYRALFETSRDALMTVEPGTWKFTRANKETLRLFGIPAEAAFVKKMPWSLSPKFQPDGRLSSEKAREMLKLTVRNGSHYFEWLHKHSDGTSFPAEVLLTMVDIGGKSVILAGLRDITARKKTETALLESERFLSSVVGNIPNTVFVKDAKDLKFVRVNKAAEELFGRTEAELRGTSDYDNFPEKEADFFVQTDRKVLSDNKLVNIPEERIHGRDGQEKILHTKKIPILDNNGKPLYLLGISEDITEHRRMEKLLIENEETLRQIFETATDAISLKGVDGRYIKANKACADLFRVEAEKMIGRTPEEIFSPQMAADIQKDDGEVIETGKTVFMNKEWVGPTGKIYLSVARTPIRGADGRMTGVLSVTRDITGIKKMETELAVARAADALSKAARPMAHDFNNALTAIVGYATLIDDELPAENPIKMEIAQIVKAVRRAADLTSKFQDFARNPKLNNPETPGKNT